MRKLIFIVIIAFILFSCDNELMNENINPFIGTWENTQTDNDGNLSKEGYIFTENQFTYYSEGFALKTDEKYIQTKEPFSRTDTGIYQSDNSTITFTYLTINGHDTTVMSVVINYFITNNELTLIVRDIPVIYYKTNQY